MMIIFLQKILPSSVFSLFVNKEKQYRLWTKSIPYFVLFTFVLLLYIPVLNAPFIWDDEVMIIGNPLIRSWESIHDIFLSSAFGGKLSSSSFYRPIQILTFLINFQFSGLDPFWFRLTNVVIHGISTVLVYELFKHFNLTAKASFIAALIFGIHPVHLECTTYISGRGDALYLLCCLASFLCLLRNGFFWKTACISFFLMAIVTKENSIILPFLILIYMWKAEIYKKSFWICFAIQICIALVYMVPRLIPAWSGHQTEIPLSFIAQANIVERLLTLSYILPTYLRLLIFPYPLHMEYLTVIKDWSNLYIWLWFPLSILGLGGLYFIIKDKSYYYAGLLWFFIGLAPVSQVLIPLAATLREHWVYMASIGYFLILGKLLMDYPKIGIGIAALLIPLYTGFTLDRNKDWMDPMQFYTHDLFYEPNSFLINNNIGVLHYRNGNFKEAERYFEKAIYVSPAPGYSISYNNLGVLKMKENDIKTAENYFTTSTLIDKNAEAYTNLVKTKIMSNKISEAKKITEMGLSFNPYSENLKKIKDLLNQY